MVYYSSNVWDRGRKKTVSMLTSQLVQRLWQMPFGHIVIKIYKRLSLNIQKDDSYDIGVFISWRHIRKKI